jgi:2-oxoglutarate dehydrogenase E1 component
MLRPLRKPLIVFTPKSLLRNPLSTSSLAELETGAFQPVIDDAQADPARVERVVVCTGHVWFDLVAASAALGEGGARVALVRLEQLYPFPEAALAALLTRYPNAGELVWAQEEPKNQGAWFQIQHRLNRAAPVCGERTLCFAVTSDWGERKQRFTYAGRAASAAPASGYASRHKAELAALVAEALGVEA